MLDNLIIQRALDRIAVNRTDLFKQKDIRITFKLLLAINENPNHNPEHYLHSVQSDMTRKTFYKHKQMLVDAEFINQGPVSLTLNEPFIVKWAEAKLNGSSQINPANDSLPVDTPILPSLPQFKRWLENPDYKDDGYMLTNALMYIAGQIQNGDLKLDDVVHHDENFLGETVAKTLERVLQKAIETDLQTFTFMWILMQVMSNRFEYLNTIGYGRQVGTYSFSTIYKYLNKD